MTQLKPLPHYTSLWQRNHNFHNQAYYIEAPQHARNCNSLITDEMQHWINHNSKAQQNNSVWVQRYCQSRLTESNNAESISSNSCRTSCCFSQGLRACYLLPITHHVGQPECSSVEVQDEGHGWVSYLLHSITRNIRHSNACKDKYSLLLNCCTVSNEIKSPCEA